MTSLERLTSSQKLRAALHRDVQSISQETCHYLGLELSKSAAELVAELVYRKISVYGTDLEAFAKHAKRTTINTEDVKLLVRRCPSLKAHLNILAPATPSSKEKNRKTKPTTVAAQEIRIESVMKSSEQNDSEGTASKLNKDKYVEAEPDYMDCVDLTI